MRTIFICLCFLVIGHRDGSRAANNEEFKPTPIPLNDWKGSSVEGGASAEEVIATDQPQHYWEDALRHSVYLTLVRDKIDQLIAKGSVISPDTKPDFTASKEVDDHNLWEKIKSAPFDRLKPQEAPALSDITILAKGRLLETNDNFRFVEDEPSKEKCSDAKCMDGVQAFWSVRRVRQRDAETIPGKYHYELTFSVTSQTQKQHKKPYDNLVRTFTVRESNPTEETKLRVPEPIKYTPRPQRAIWFHKNINPVPNYHSRKTYQGSSLDRLFFSLFSDDNYKDDYQPRYKPVHQPQTAQQSKLGHAGPVERYHQKKVPPYRYKPLSFNPHRPPANQNFAPPAPIPQPPIQPSNDYDTKYTHYSDHKHLPTNLVKTTKPAVLPTPTFIETNFTLEATNRTNTTEYTNKEPETITYKTYTKQKQPPIKVSYLPEHVRPPVFNAPPGVFMTMEKKPFKPMPPLKVPHYHTKPYRSKPPVDFRPSPQVLDAQFSDPEPLSDSFRPINMNYRDRNTTEYSDLAAGLSGNKHSTKSKPLKKQENKKSHRTTTSTPEIITAQHSLSMDKITLESMQWANNILGAFSKTTPMASERLNFSDIDDLLTKPITTTITVPTEPTWLTTTEEVLPTTTTEASTTTEFIPKVKKRTRPPPKFTDLKENPVKKIKKHKRITSTTTSTSTTSTTTLRPRPLSKRPLPDLTPQASSAATGNKDLEAEIHNDTFTTTSTTVDLKDTSPPITTTSTTTPRPTTVTRSTIKTTTTAAPTTTTVPTTTEDRNKNRFRQTMLMQKGTSVKHDKWSTTNNFNLDKTKTVIPLASKYQQQSRRKASNFHGYISSTQKTVEEERNKDDHRDRLPDSHFNEIRNTTVKSLKTPGSKNTEEQTTNVESPPHNSDEVQFSDMKEQEANTEDSEDDLEIKDQSEYIFSVTTETSKSQETGDPELIIVTEVSVINPTHSSGKNKTKCKKKKHGNNTLTDEASPSSNDLDETMNSTTEASAVSDIFDEIFGYTAKDNVKPNQAQTDQIHEGSDNYEHYVHGDDDLESFLESISSTRQEQEAVYDEGDDDSGDDYTNNSDNESRTLRHEDIPEHREVHEHPFSFLELMGME